MMPNVVTDPSSSEECLTKSISNLTPPQLNKPYNPSTYTISPYVQYLHDNQCLQKYQAEFNDLISRDPVGWFDILIPHIQLSDEQYFDQLIHFLNTQHPHLSIDFNSIYSPRGDGSSILSRSFLYNTVPELLIQYHGTKLIKTERDDPNRTLIVAIQFLPLHTFKLFCDKFNAQWRDQFDEDFQFQTMHDAYLIKLCCALVNTQFFPNTHHFLTMFPSFLPILTTVLADNTDDMIYSFNIDCLYIINSVHGVDIPKKNFLSKHNLLNFKLNPYNSLPHIPFVVWLINFFELNQGDNQTMWENFLSNNKAKLLSSFPTLQTIFSPTQSPLLYAPVSIYDIMATCGTLTPCALELILKNQPELDLNHTQEISSQYLPNTYPFVRFSFIDQAMTAGNIELVKFLTTLGYQLTLNNIPTVVCVMTKLRPSAVVLDEVAKIYIDSFRYISNDIWLDNKENDACAEFYLEQLEKQGQIKSDNNFVENCLNYNPNNQSFLLPTYKGGRAPWSIAHMVRHGASPIKKCRVGQTNHTPLTYYVANDPERQEFRYEIALFKICDALVDVLLSGITYKWMESDL